jgi:hypothetical protein
LELTILASSYARILARIEQNLNPKERLMVRKIMEWLGCAKFLPTVEELLQALAITPGQEDFLKGRKVFRDIFKLCGPIIEIENNVVQFVHFTAKECVSVLSYIRLTSQLILIAAGMCSANKAMSFLIMLTEISA